MYHPVELCVGHPISPFDVEHYPEARCCKSVDTFLQVLSKDPGLAAI